MLFHVQTHVVINKRKREEEEEIWSEIGKVVGVVVQLQRSYAAIKMPRSPKKVKAIMEENKILQNEEKFSRRKSLTLHRTITLLGRRRCHPAASVGSVLLLQDAGIIYYDHYLFVSSYNIQTYRSEHKCLVEPKFSIHTEHLVHLTGSRLYKFLVAIEFCSPLQKV